MQTRKTPKPRSLNSQRLWFYFRLLLTTSPLLLVGIGVLASSIFVPEVEIQAVKEILLAISTGIIALTGAYIGAALQGQAEKEKELRQTRRNRTLIYRDYIAKLMSISQRVEMVKGFSVDEKYLLEIQKEERKHMIQNQPPMYEFSVIEDKTCRYWVDQAIDLGIKYWNQNGNLRPKTNEIEVAYKNALEQLDYYENLL